MGPAISPYFDPLGDGDEAYDRGAGPPRRAAREEAEAEAARREEAEDDGGAMSLDARRLRARHATEGYRDGIAAGKAGSIQGGFDGGFELGAHVGLRAGRVLGLLEGIAAALRGRGGGRGGPLADAAAAAAERLLADAAAELTTDAVFAEEYWTPDGSWRYSVTPREGADSAVAVALSDVAGQHPLIAKWEGLATREIERWGLN
ncbi:hypothetical protein GGS23DRAFT_595508 [Durotheca rogersii]|uniref:uncharacterized protein n=1 Tax=Durotheca rogersii TaxID=419775 RepID=UPI00221E65C0|nr:uncharacterized protein GGS23DRAFT_595508 [Durotheca rogersii]KAI5864814.1 hypothetical protein GGS23DRAFT_595508 [Durotheca rogersii]